MIKKFKLENGITLTALIIYIIVMVFVMMTLASISSFFFSNISTLNNNDTYIKDYDRINECLVEITNKSESSIYKIGGNLGIDSTTNLNKYSKLSFYDKEENIVITYQFIDNNFYKDDYKICDTLKKDSSYFIVDDSNGEYINIKMHLEFGEKGELTKDIEYNIKAQ